MVVACNQLHHMWCVAMSRGVMPEIVALLAYYGLGLFLVEVAFGQIYAPCRTDVIELVGE